MPRAVTAGECGRASERRAPGLVPGTLSPEPVRRLPIRRTDYGCR